MRKSLKQVTRGALNGQGATMAEAKADLDRQIDWAIAWGGSPYIETRFGYVIVIARTAQGYESTMVGPEDHVHGRVKISSCLSGHDLLGVRIQSMRVNAAQNAWTPGSDDTAHVAAAGLDAMRKSELERWIAFQRAYAAAIANGATASDAHKLACGY